MYILICLFLAVLGLPCCTRAFSSLGAWGLLFFAVLRLLIAMASLAAELRLERRLNSCGTRAGFPRSCGLFLDQGSNPCPLHWQVDS